LEGRALERKRPGWNIPGGEKDCLKLGVINTPVVTWGGWGYSLSKQTNEALKTGCSNKAANNPREKTLKKRKDTVRKETEKLARVRGVLRPMSLVFKKMMKSWPRGEPSMKPNLTETGMGARQFMEISIDQTYGKKGN